MLIGLALSPGYSQILSRSRGEKSGEGLGAKLRHGLEMVDSVSTNLEQNYITNRKWWTQLVRNVDSVCTNRVHHFQSVT